MAERTVIVGSMSKAHRMIGWRVGWIAGPAAIVRDAGWVHIYNTTGDRRRSRAGRPRRCCAGRRSTWRACVAELERRRDVILDALPGWPIVRPGRRLVAADRRRGARARRPPTRRAAMLEAGVAATAMAGWGGEVAARYVRFVFSAEPVDRLATLGERLARTGLGACSGQTTAGG